VDNCSGESALGLGPSQHRVHTLQTKNAEVKALLTKWIGWRPSEYRRKKFNKV